MKLESNQKNKKWYLDINIEDLSKNAKIEDKLLLFYIIENLFNKAYKIKDSKDNLITKYRKHDINNLIKEKNVHNFLKDFRKEYKFKQILQNFSQKKKNKI
tara:strand:- start:539 stop:841 length:303 start_codon:yes stop_codon:yes gene_type:complete